METGKLKLLPKTKTTDINKKLVYTLSKNIVIKFPVNFYYYYFKFNMSHFMHLSIRKL